MLITGLSFAALIFGIWGLGVLVVRGQSRKLREAPGAELTEQIEETASEVHSIEEFIARAAALPDGSKPEPRPDHVAERDQDRLETLATHHFPHLDVPHPHIHLVGITGLE